MLVGILGGGLSGVSFQRFLKLKSEILEKEERLGGLCRSFSKDGFLYDLGGHIIYSKEKQVIRLIRKILHDNINYCRRNNKILFNGRLIKYPFENGVGELQKEDIYECLMGYLSNKHVRMETFKDWIYKTFGDGISNKYLIPYNEKIWKFPLEKMGIEWVERIPKPPTEDVIKSALGICTEGYTHQLYFNYPNSGGIENLVLSFMKNNAKVRTNFGVRKILKVGNKWLVSNGSENKLYDKLVSTIPVKEIVKFLPSVPSNVLKAARGLRHNSVKIVHIGVNNNSLNDKSAIYIHDPNVLPHRVCYMKYFSSQNVPKDMSSLIAEISMRPGSNLFKTSDSVIIEDTISGLQRVGILRKRDIVTTDVKTIDYAYIVYDVYYKKNIDTIRNYLRSVGIELLGRFGEFEYINMDEVLKRSIKLANKFNMV